MSAAIQRKVDIEGGLSRPWRRTLPKPATAVRRIHETVSRMNRTRNKLSNEDAGHAAADRNDGFAAGCDLSHDHLQSAAFLAKSLSDGNRLRILQLISGGRKSVSAIVEELELSQPLVSHHLKELKRSLMVRVEREGPFVYYELADERILNVMRTLSDVATDLLAGRKTF